MNEVYVTEDVQRRWEDMRDRGTESERDGLITAYDAIWDTLHALDILEPDAVEPPLSLYRTCHRYPSALPNDFTLYHWPMLEARFLALARHDGGPGYWYEITDFRRMGRVFGG